MTKRQNIFLILLTVLLYLSYTIIQEEYRKYLTNEYKEEIKLTNSEMKSFLEIGDQTLEYNNTPAFKNKALKESSKMIGEKVVYITHEQTYNKFKTTELITEKKSTKITEEESITKTMTNYQKWIYFLLKKDTR